MSKEITEIGSGGFRPGADAYNLGRHRINTPGPSAGADSTFSRMSQFASRKLDIEEEDEDDDDILESVAFNKDKYKYKLIETLENFLKSDDTIKEEEEELEEFSGVAAGGGGPAVPLGYTSKGKPETPSQRKKRQKFNITKSFPYTSSVKQEAKINRVQLRHLIYKTLNESKIKDKKINVINGNINIDGANYKVQANAGWKTAGKFIDIALSSVAMASNGLRVIGSAIGTSVDELVPTDKVNEINKGVDSGKASFTVKGKKATFKFIKIS